MSWWGECREGSFTVLKFNKNKIKKISLKKLNLNKSSQNKMNKMLPSSNLFTDWTTKIHMATSCCNNHKKCHKE